MVCFLHDSDLRYERVNTEILLLHKTVTQRWNASQNVKSKVSFQTKSNKGWQCINSFYAIGLFLYPLETLENFSFHGVQKETSSMKWVNKQISYLSHFMHQINKLKSSPDYKLTQTSFYFMFNVFNKIPPRVIMYSL